MARTALVDRNSGSYVESKYDDADLLVKRASGGTPLAESAERGSRTTRKRLPGQENA